jgi:signal peptidase
MTAAEATVVDGGTAETEPAGSDHRGAAPTGSTGTGDWSRQVIRVVAVALAVITIPTAMLVVSAWLTGRSLQIVESGSMAPTMPVGSLAVVRPARASEVQVGDIVVFDEAGRGRQVSHRVMAIDSASVTEGPNFTTRGDANATDDPEAVPATAVRGVVQHHVPGLGGWLGALRWPLGPVLLVGLPLALLVADLVLGARRAA